MARLPLKTLKDFREPTANKVTDISTDIVYRGLVITFDDNQLYSIRGLENKFNKLSAATQFIDAAFNYGERYNG